MRSVHLSRTLQGERTHTVCTRNMYHQRPVWPPSGEKAQVAPQPWTPRIAEEEEGGYQSAHAPTRGRKRRAQEAIGLTPQEIVIDICNRSNRGEQITPAEIRLLRDIAFEEGAPGIYLVPDVPSICRSALTKLMTTSATRAVGGNRPTAPILTNVPPPHGPFAMPYQ